MKTPVLSVTLATYNEEDNMERCLQSVKDLADEIVIVDGSSEDNTVEIAKRFKARVKVTSNKPNFHINKQLANDMAKGKWILQLDADEVVSDALKEEIKLVVSLPQKELNYWRVAEEKWVLYSKQQTQIEKRDGRIGDSTGEVVAFFIPRRNFFLGSFLRHTGVYPDGVIRLFQNKKARLPCKHVHEQYKVDGRVVWLEYDLLHYDSPTFERYMMRNNRYSSLFAEELAEKKVEKNWWNAFMYMYVKPWQIFLNLFIPNAGYKDGFPGFVFSYYSGLTWATAWVKYWEKKN